GLTESPLEQAIRMLRKTRTTFFILDQDCASLPNSARSNFSTIAALRLPNYDDRIYVASAMGLSREQADAIASLKLRMGIVTNPALPGPVLFKIRELAPLPKPDPASLRTEMDELLARSFPYKPALPSPLEPQPAPQTKVVAKEERRVRADEL